MAFALATSANYIAYHSAANAVLQHANAQSSAALELPFAAPTISISPHANRVERVGAVMRYRGAVKAYSNAHSWRRESAIESNDAISKAKRAAIEREALIVAMLALTVLFLRMSTRRPYLDVMC